MIKKKATIEWVPQNDGGRLLPPIGTGNPSYAAVVHFVDENWPHTSGSWSLVVEKDESQSTEYHWLADVHYLVANAPHESLCQGRRFELYEGQKCVARGPII
jgi:hypothetical protein